MLNKIDLRGKINSFKCSVNESFEIHHCSSVTDKLILDLKSTDSTSKLLIILFDSLAEGQKVAARCEALIGASSYICIIQRKSNLTFDEDKQAWTEVLQSDSCEAWFTPAGTEKGSIPKRIK